MRRSADLKNGDFCAIDNSNMTDYFIPCTYAQDNYGLLQTLELCRAHTPCAHCVLCRSTIVCMLNIL